MFWKTDWPAMNEKVKASDVESAAKKLKTALEAAASAAGRAQRSFSSASESQRTEAIHTAETLARAELGLSPHEPIPPKTWLSFDMACAGKLGLIPLASQAKLARDEAVAWLAELPVPPGAMDLARAELAASNAQKKASEARLQHADARAAVLPYSGTVLSPKLAKGRTLDELRDLYDQRSRLLRAADFIARPDVHVGAKALAQARALGHDPFALARAESESAERSTAAAREFKERSEALEKMRRDASIHASRKEAATRPSPWLDENAASPSQARALVFDATRDWSAAFEQLSRTRPHLAPMAAAAAAASLSQSALLGASQRCSSEQAGLLKAAGHLDTLAASMKKLRSKSSSAQAKLQFDMAEVYQSAMDAKKRFTEWAESGPAAMVERARHFQPGQGEAPAQALLSARAVFGEATPALSRRDPLAKSDAPASSSSLSSSSSTTSTWEALFWHQLLFDAGQMNAARGFEAVAAPAIDFGQSGGSASWASSEFSSSSSYEASSSCSSSSASCSSRSSCSSASSCSSRSSCASSSSSSCSSSSSSSCSSGSSCSSCSS